MKHEHSIEALHHFRCHTCKKWWSVSDATRTKKKWYCPWCGAEGTI